MRRLIFPSTCPCWRSSSDLRLAASVPNPKCVTKFPGGASRLTALLLAYICPICSLVAPCDPGAAPGTLATNFGIGTLGAPRRLAKQPAHEHAQLIEVVGTRDVDVVADRDLGAFVDDRDTEDDHGHALGQAGAASNARRTGDDVDRWPAQAHQNQVGPLASRFLYRVVFAPCRMDAIPVGRKQLLDPVPGFLDIVRNE